MTATDTASELKFTSATRFFTIATAGHVDHGKTSLLRNLTGQDPDRLKEEKERQMTTDLGFAYLMLSSKLVLGFVDVPGHGKFLKNMLAGVGGIDIALLVVAADEGPMPQTRQHVRILSLLGVSKAIVAISKIDLVEEKEELELVKEEVGELLNAHGIEALAFVMLSNQSGEGINELKANLKEILEKLPAKNTSASLFLPVDRVFSKAGFGTVITGTVVSGKIEVGDQIFVEPGDLNARVRRLETHGQQVNIASPGQRVACNLVVKEGEKLKRGFVLSGKNIAASRSLIVSLYDRPRLLKQALSERLSDQPVRLYHGTAEYQGFLRWVEDCASEGSEIAQTQEGIGFLALQDNAVLAAQDRFVIRLTDDTIYGGKILVRERPRFLSKGEIIKLAGILEKGKYTDALKRFLDDSPQLMLKDEQIDAIIPAMDRQALIERSIKEGWLLRLADYFLSRESRDHLSSKLIACVSELSAQTEDPEGITIEQARQKLHPKLERQAFATLLEEECKHGNIVRKQDRLFLPGERVAKATDPALAAAETRLRDLLSSHWCLELDELSELSELNLKLVKTVVQQLTKSGDFVIASYDFVASKEKIAEAHQILQDLWIAKRSIAPTDFKEKIGVSRKYAMALLQYFDDCKITRRLDSGRVLLKGPSR